MTQRMVDLNTKRALKVMSTLFNQDVSPQPQREGGPGGGRSTTGGGEGVKKGVSVAERRARARSERAPKHDFGGDGL